jgi:hypothetical protein
VVLRNMLGYVEQRRNWRCPMTEGRDQERFDAARHLRILKPFDAHDKYIIDRSIEEIEHLQRELAAQSSVIEQIRALHVKGERVVVFGAYYHACAGCARPWPCATAEALSSLPTTGGVNRAMGCDSQYDLTPMESADERRRSAQRQRGYYSVDALLGGPVVHAACGTVVGDLDAHGRYCPASASTGETK